MSFTCQIVGFAAFQRTVLGLPDAILEAGAEALKPELAGVLAASKELCPVDTGRLRDSGELSDPKFADNQVVYSLAYGGDNGEIHYALLQHERLDYTHGDGKTAKFLERPLMEWTQSGPARAFSRLKVKVRVYA